MTVRELIELNQMITDVEITVRKNGWLLDQLNIGPAEGRKPPCPTKVPQSEIYLTNMSVDTKRDAYYIQKNLNAWDDGKDYWQIKPDRIPKKWLELEVYSWEVWPASIVGCPRREIEGKFKNVNFNGQRINIEAVTSGEKLEVEQERKDKRPTEEIKDNYMSLLNWKEEAERSKEDAL